MTDIKMQTEYSGYGIKWSDCKLFEISKDGIDLKQGIKTLEECQKWIDAKNKQKFKRVPVLHKFGYNDSRKAGEATSIVEGDYVWVSSGKDRNKAKMSDVWLDTPENRKALDDIKTKNDQINALRAEIGQIQEATARLTADMMINEAGA